MAALVNQAALNAASIFFIFGLALIHLALAADIEFHWTMENKTMSPDCSNVDSPIIKINGQFPGPTIRARAGDRIIVHLTNNLENEGTVIHWHGITQMGTPWADGTAFISQCPIPPGKTFTYDFIVPQAGTFFYHGHLGMQRSAGLYGSLIVDVAEGQKEPFEYDDEFNLLLSDWWHNSSTYQENLLGQPGGWIGEPQTLLINGRGLYRTCSLVSTNAGKQSTTVSACVRGKEHCAPQMLNVEPNKTYRLRLASTTALSSLNFKIDNHKLTVVEADGNYVEPFEVDDIDIHSGESYSVLLKTDQHPSKYWISLCVRGRAPGTSQALSILNYSPNSDAKKGNLLTTVNPSTVLPSPFPPSSRAWSDYESMRGFSMKILAPEGSSKPPEKSDRRIILLNTQNTVDKINKWSINNVSLNLPETPYLGAIKYDLKEAFDQKEPPERYPMEYDISKPPANTNTRFGNGAYRLRYGSTIDVILQNANVLKKNHSEIHPWHLHGYEFWVIGYGEGKFTEDDVKNFNLNNPPLRNTVVIYPFGWTALRFVANNPGVWAFHCHIEPHLHMGMGVVFAESVDQIDFGKVPEGTFSCGALIGKMQNDMGEAPNYSMAPAPAPQSGFANGITAPSMMIATLISLVVIMLLEF